MMVDLSESQVLEGQMTKAFDGFVGREFGATDLLEEFADGFGVHGGF